MTIGKPIGQTAFISSPIVTTEQAYSHARPRGGERPDFRGMIPPTEEQIQKVADYESHATARAGAARSSTRRTISTEELNSRAAIDARSAAIGTEAAHAQLEALQTLVAQQAAAITRLQARIDTIDSNSSIGDQL